MIELPIYNMTGKQVETLAIDEAQLGGEVRHALLKQAYVMFHANRRQGSARTKNRGRVAGSTRKIYKQKGTGNARMGTVRTNLRKGGGVTFAKLRTREEFKRDMPKKMRRLANRNALLAKLVDSEVKCFDTLDFKEPKTASFRELLQAVGVNRSCLVALDGGNRNAALSARNLPDVRTCRADQLNAFDLLNHRFLVVERDMLKKFVDGTLWERAEANGSSEPAKPQAAEGGGTRKKRGGAKREAAGGAAGKTSKPKKSRKEATA
jgi:large subunit ribosomal protein L4